jgi:hypothetical protein
MRLWHSRGCTGNHALEDSGFSTSVHTQSTVQRAHFLLYPLAVLLMFYCCSMFERQYYDSRVKGARAKDGTSFQFDSPMGLPCFRRGHNSIKTGPKQSNLAV